MRTGYYSDLDYGVKEAAFEDHVRMGDPLALAEVLTLSENEKRKKINAWWNLAVLREPFLKDLLKPTPEELERAVETLVTPVVRKEPVIEAKKKRLRNIDVGYFPDTNRELSIDGGIHRHGMAVLYEHTARYRHARKALRIKGRACEIDKERLGEGRDEIFSTSKYRRERALAHIKWEIEHWESRGHPPYYFGSHGPLVWEQDLTMLALEHLNFSLAARLAVHKWRKSQIKRMAA